MQAARQMLGRLDRGLAQGEAALAAAMLLAMIVVAAVQALLRNLTNLELTWANEALAAFAGADIFLQKGTLWVAFLGASLATHEQKHIAIDIVPRLMPPRVRALLRGVVGIAAGAISFMLARVFWMAVLNNAVDRGLEYEVLVGMDALHVCDAPQAALDDAGMQRPAFFCALRSLLGGLGAPVETRAAAAELVVPVMFLLIALRLLFNGMAALGRSFGEGDPDPHAGLERVAEDEGEYLKG